MATKRNRNTATKAPIKQSLIQRLGSMLTSITIVFSYWAYIALSGTIVAIFWIIFNVFEQLLFFSPIVVFYLPEDAILAFILLNIVVVLLGIVVSLNIFMLKHSRGIKLNAASFFSGSSIGVLSSTCASCSSFGFLLVSTLGGAGMALSTFLSNYQTPLRIVSIVLLLWTYYSASIRLTKGCKVKP